MSFHGVQLCRGEVCDVFEYGVGYVIAEEECVERYGIRGAHADEIDVIYEFRRIGECKRTQCERVVRV